MANEAPKERVRGYLVLGNGRVFEGWRAGADTDSAGEICFTTGMVGYLETITDPSYAGQIITQTFPLMGNYGVIEEDFEGAPACKGYIAREICRTPSNFRSRYALDEYLRARGIPALEGIDTRELTRIIREEGVMNSVICSDPEEGLRIAREPAGSGFVPEVSCREPYTRPAIGEKLFSVVLIDYGVKASITRCLCELGCEVTVVPYDTRGEDILAMAPDGVMLSNGPGNPQDNPVSVEQLKKVIGRVPVFGICLGHQIAALAMGAETVKLKYGHRGANQPVRDLRSGRTYITSQNHGYAVLAQSLDGVGTETFINANDGSNEGMEYPGKNCYTVQFHPEARSGPHDTEFLFERFIKMMSRSRLYTPPIAAAPEAPDVAPEAEHPADATPPIAPELAAMLAASNELPAAPPPPVAAVIPAAKPVPPIAPELAAVLEPPAEPVLKPAAVPELASMLEPVSEPESAIAPELAAVLEQAAAPEAAVTQGTDGAPQTSENDDTVAPHPELAALLVPGEAPATRQIQILSSANELKKDAESLPPTVTPHPAVLAVLDERDAPQPPAPLSKPAEKVIASQPAPKPREDAVVSEFSLSVEMDSGAASGDEKGLDGVTFSPLFAPSQNQDPGQPAPMGEAATPGEIKETNITDVKEANEAADSPVPAIEPAAEPKAGEPASAPSAEEHSEPAQTPEPEKKPAQAGAVPAKSEASSASLFSGSAMPFDFELPSAKQKDAAAGAVKPSVKLLSDAGAPAASPAAPPPPGGRQPVAAPAPASAPPRPPMGSVPSAPQNSASAQNEGFFGRFGSLKGMFSRVSGKTEASSAPAPAGAPGALFSDPNLSAYKQQNAAGITQGSAKQGDEPLPPDSAMARNSEKILDVEKAGGDVTTGSAKNGGGQNA